MLVSYFRKSREKNNIFAHNVVPSQAGPLEARQARMSLNTIQTEFFLQNG